MAISQTKQERSSAEIFAANLARLMRERNAEFPSQASLAAPAGVNQRTISRCLEPELWPIKRTSRAPTLTSVDRIAKALRVNAWELLRPHSDAAQQPGQGAAQ